MQNVAKQGKETVGGIVEKRYGEEAGKVVSEGFEVGENVLGIHYARKGVVAKIATASAKEFIKDELKEGKKG